MNTIVEEEKTNLKSGQKLKLVNKYLDKIFKQVYSTFNITISILVDHIGWDYLDKTFK